jgi:hypothetical protein
MEVDSSRSTSITTAARVNMGPTSATGTHWFTVGLGRPDRVVVDSRGKRVDEGGQASAGSGRRYQTGGVCRDKMPQKHSISQKAPGV